MNTQENIPRAGFTGLFINAEILEIEDLTPMEILLLSWIDALGRDNEKGGCFAKNEYLAKKMNMKENTIAKSISKLRSMGLIEDVSFDGRCRVIRATIHEFIVEQRKRKAALDLNPTLDGTKIQPCIGNKSIPTYRDIKDIDKIDIKPPIPPNDPPSNSRKSAKADESDFNHFSEIAFLLAQRIVSLLETHNTAYTPVNPNTLVPELCKLLGKKKCSPQEIIDIVTWGVDDNFWKKHFYKSKRNLAKYIHDNYASFHASAYPPAVKAPKKERKFLPSSNDAQALRNMEELEARAIR